MMNKDVGFSWNSGLEEDDENKIVVVTCASSSSSSALINLHHHSTQSLSPTLTSPTLYFQQLEDQNPTSTTPSDDFSFWSDIIQPQPQLPSQQQLLLQQLLLLQQQQQQQQQQQDYEPNVACLLPQVLNKGGESSSHQVVESAPPQTDQVGTTATAKGRTSDTPPGSSRQQNKRLKSAQTSAHNIAEKRRRDRFKERIKTLQQLLPECDKGDTASVLDEAVKQIQLLKFQTEEQYIRAQTNVLGMVQPYPSMLHYPAAAAASGVGVYPRMQMLPYFTPPRPLFPFIAPAPNPRPTSTQLIPPTASQPQSQPQATASAFASAAKSAPSSPDGARKDAP